MAALASAANTAEACSCTPQSAGCGPSAGFWRAGAVFLGRVMAVERLKGQDQRYLGQRRVRVQILERFRGPLPAAGGEAMIFTGFCGYPFKLGQEYLIYAVRQDDGRLTTSVCSRTALADRATVDLAYAHEAAAGRAPAGRIVGFARQETEYPSRWKPMPGVPITASRGDASVTTVSDAQGRYTIEAPQAGTYAVDVRLPETHYTLQAGHSVELPDPHACAEVNVDIFFNGHVSGRVVDSEGKGIAGLTVLLAHQRRTRGEPQERRRTLTRADGAYEIDRVPPGVSTIAIELPADNDGEPSDRAAEDQSMATRAMLSGGQRLSLDPLVLPATLQIVRIEGTVQSPDGAPAAGARVFLKSAAEAGRIFGAPAVTDSLGRFAIAALGGEQYQVFAERDNAGGHLTFSDPVPVHADQPVPLLRLTVRRRF